MRHFYKIEDGNLLTGVSIEDIPEGCVEYNPESPDKEFQEVCETNNLIEENRRLIVESKKYLADTDWYYSRKMETGDEVPADVVAKRTEAREFLRNQGY